MPAAVYCTAINEKPTPIKGPVKTATSIAQSPLCSFRLDCICPAFPLTNNQAEKQNNPATQRIMLDEKGRYNSIEGRMSDGTSAT